MLIDWTLFTMAGGKARKLSLSLRTRYRDINSGGLTTSLSNDVHSFTQARQGTENKLGIASLALRLVCGIVNLVGE